MMAYAHRPWRSPSRSTTATPPMQIIKHFCWMHESGVSLFGSGQMQLRFVLQSADTK